MRSISIKKPASPWRGIGIFLAISVACLLIILVLGKLVNKKDLFGKDKIAIVKVEGVIMNSELLVKKIKEHTKNPTVKAMVIRVNSPGGGVGPSQEIYETIKRITEQKKIKVVISMASVAASGGYYISCSADRIVANPGTITGSLGVIMHFPYFEGLMDKLGLKNRNVKSGSFKDIGSPFREMKPEETALMQSMVDDVHAQFVEAIATGRNLSKEEVEEFADGRIFSGRQAKELGLVDELGGLDVALESAAEIAGLDLEKTVILEEKKPFDLSKFFSSMNRFLENLSALLDQSTTASPVQYLWR